MLGRLCFEDINDLLISQKAGNQPRIDDRSFFVMNIRVFLSEVPGSTEAVIEAIEQCLKDKQPFGLKCQRSSVVFIPHLFKAY